MCRVVVTGIGVVAPNGIGRREFCEAILEGRSGVSYIESFDTTGLPIKIAGEIRNFDVLPYLGDYRKNAKLMSRAVRFAVGAAAMAVEDSGIRPDQLDPALRGLHGDGNHPDGCGGTGQSDSSKRGRLRALRSSTIRPGALRIDFSALAATAFAQHGCSSYFDPSSRDGAKQYDRHSLRRGYAGRG